MADVRAEWGRYAPLFAAESGADDRPSIRRLVEMCALPSGSLVLDVATGAGYTAFSFARAGCVVVALDPTHEMLIETRTGSADRGLATSLTEAWAEALPFGAHTFDGVVSHRAPHQFADIGAFVTEARRLLKPGGILGVSDQSPPDGWETWHDDLERMRDPTHAHSLSRRQWRSAVVGAGLDWEQSDVVFQPHDVEDWLDRVDCPPERRAACIEMLERIPAEIRETYGPERRDGRLVMRTPQLVFVARS